MSDIFRVDANAKVEGKALYFDDLRFPNMLYVAVIRSPYAHAKLLSMDISETLNTEGVVSVLKADDFPSLCVKPCEKPVLVKDTAKCCGDGVALVVAKSIDIARAATKKAVLEWNVLTPILCAEEALAENAPKIHEEGNIAYSHSVRKGNVALGFEQCEVIIEREFRTQRTQHAALEPEGAVVVPDNDGKLILYCPCKGPFNVRRYVAEVCSMPLSKVRLIQPIVGGSFGGKDDDTSIAATRAALAALATHCACKVIYSREEASLEGVKRHPFKLTYKIGARNDGKIVALKVNGLVDGGAYLSRSKSTISRASVDAAGPYEIENIDVDITCTYSNNTHCGALRGFGSPQVDFAMESIIDELAKALKISPYFLRSANILKEGSISACGQEMEDVTAEECLKKLSEVFPDCPSRTASPGKVRGRGIACLCRGESMGSGSDGLDVASADVLIQRDGSVNISTGISEVGQGGYTLLAAVVCEVLGIPESKVTVNPLDTAYIMDGGATVGSRGSITFGNAVKMAATELKDKIARNAANHLGVAPESLSFKGEKITTVGGIVGISYYEAVERCYRSKERLFGTGWWQAPPVFWDKKSCCGEPYFSYTYGAVGAEVEIDLGTGKITICDLVAVHDLGKIINEAEVRSQITGGIVMGLGFTLFEKVEQNKGLQINTNFDRYLLPTIMYVGKIRVYPMEVKPGKTPLGVHGIGEPSTVIIAPAVINAVTDALGVRVYNLPADLEKLRNAAMER